jgi:uncharacterized membrane protein
MNPRRRRIPNQHPVNRALIDDAPLGVRVADDVTGFMGSWRFIIIQTVIVIIWIVGNVYLIFHFDPYPFILLNLAFSTQAAYAAPLILLAGNRSAQRDRMTLEHTATEADKEEEQNLDILDGIRRLEEGNKELLERVVGLEQTIIANQRVFAQALPGLTGKLGQVEGEQP